MEKPTTLPQLQKEVAHGKLWRGAGELIMVLVPALLVLLIAEHLRPPSVPASELNGAKPEISDTLAAFGRQLEWLYVWIEILLTAISAILFNWMVGWIDFHKTVDRIRVIDRWVESVTAHIERMGKEVALMPAVSEVVGSNDQHTRQLLTCTEVVRKSVEKMQQQLVQVVTDRKASDAIQALAKDFGCEHPIHLYGKFLTALTKDGHLTVFDLTDVFETDIELISRLAIDRSGPLISTVLPNDLSLDIDIQARFPAFRKYMNAQVQAAADGLEVHRLYLISKLDRTDQKFLTHLQELGKSIAAHKCEQKFKVYVVDLSACTLIGNHFDLVAFGGRCISFGRLDKQEMALIGAEYYKIGHGPSDKEQQYAKLKDIINQMDRSRTAINGIYGATKYLNLVLTAADETSSTHK